MFEEAKYLQRPDDRGYDGRVPFTDENIECWYPSATHTRYIMTLNNSFCPEVHPGFYSIDAWLKYQKEQREREEKWRRQEAYEQTWEYKRKQFVGRLHRAFDVLRGREEDD